MSHKLKRLKAHIKDKIEKLKAEYQRQKTLPKEQTCDISFTQLWFDRMRSIVDVFAKGDALEGGTNQGRLTWEANINDQVSETPSNHLPNFLPIPLDKDDGNVGDQEYVTLPLASASHFQGTVVGEGSILIGNSPCIASCKKPEVPNKSNAHKICLTDTVYFANAIANFVEVSIRVEKHKATISKEMTILLITSNETINKGDNDVLFKIIQLEIEA